MCRRPFIICVLLCLLSPSLGRSQQSPLLTESTYNKLANEISGDIAYDNLRSLVMYHAPRGESQGFLDEAEWVAARAKAYGLEDVHFIALPSWRSNPKAVDHNWTLLGGELWLTSPKTIKLGDVRETPTSVADNSPAADLNADLIDVGEGSSESDYSGRDVAGKVVLAYGPPNRVKELACWAHGAVAIVSYYSTRTDPWTDHADQVAWTRVNASQEGEKPAPPVFVISPRQGLALSHEMSGRGATHIFSDATAATSSTPTFRVHLKVESKVTQPGRQGFVEGFIRGTTYHDQAIVLTAHMQEEKTSANDDRSGCANLLEIARALEAMTADGRLPRPRRDIRFWWTNEISAEYEYFSQHPEERQHIIADINEDMVGAKQSLGGRVQHVSRTPYSRWGFLNDVVVSIVTSLVQGNNAYLASWQNHNQAPYSRPVFSHLGSREPYHAELVHYFDSTDHMVFNEGSIGIPGVTFTNWPDEYIHSSDDDLWQIDRTQLQRNALAVAASAVYLADLNGAEVPNMLAVMAGNARERLSHDLALGLSGMAEAARNKELPTGSENAAGSFNDLHSAYHDALLLLDEAEKREVAGLESARRFAPEKVQKLLESLEEDMKLTELNHQKRIEEWYSALGGTPGHSKTEEREKEPDSQVPKNLGTLREYLSRIQQIEGPAGLHGLMKFEALNFVDGKRSILDIYHAVRAESLSAGEWYYGTVRLEDIETLFKLAEQEKAVEIVNR
ncbi:MAG TPA: M28 family metallopeptidase [Terriglobia bacterium]|nr:M28 family metallopeptidase [Terriglobia bacterium]